MGMLRICATMSLALWVGGLSLFMGVVLPVTLKSFQKPEATRYLDVLFPAMDRWGFVWALVAAGSIFLLFLNRHFALRSLVLEIPVALMLVLTFYTSQILHPQIYDLKRKIDLPELQQTAHLESLKFAFHRLHRLSVQLNGVILFLGLLSLGLTPRFLK